VSALEAAELGAPRLAPPKSVATTEEAWLERQCRMIGARAGLVAVRAAESMQVVAAWPAVEAAVPLGGMIARASEEQSGIYVRLPGESAPPAWAIALPVLAADRVRAVAAMIVRCEEGAALLAVMRQLEWGAAGLHLVLALRENRENQDRADSLGDGLETLSHMLAEPDFDAAALALVTEMANRFGAERVSYGTVRREVAHLCAISHSGQFGRKMTLVRQIEAAMQEALDQQCVVVAAPAADAGDALVSRAARALAEQGGGAVASMPLMLAGKAVGVLTVETGQREVPPPAVLGRIESLATIAAAALHDKAYRAKPLASKIGMALGDAFGQIVGTRHATAKLATVTAAAILAFLVLAKTEYRLASEATLTSLSQQLITAPFAGYIGAAPVRAGDRVAAGDVLATLDDRDLQLERLRLLGELARTEGQHQRAVADRDRARVGIHAAEREQYLAQLSLMSQQLQRASLRAPFDGLVVSGDLSQRLGAAVERGEVLFAIAPVDSYRLDLRIRESRIGDVQVGQRGVLLLSARPGDRIGFTINRLTPRVVATEGQTYFVAEASLDGAVTQELQPGMQGVGRIMAGEVSYWRIWTRDLLDWLRLMAWSWRP
jgi:multidrug resistance efflux pump